MLLKPCSIGRRSALAVVSACSQASGAYEESGSVGRLDRFGITGARILNFPLRSPPAYGLGRVVDPDRIVQLARKDLPAATESLFEQLTPVTPAPADWPDLLAYDLINDPTLQLREWAQRQGLAPESLARGFRKVFAIYAVAPSIGHNVGDGLEFAIEYVWVAFL